MNLNLNLFMTCKFIEVKTVDLCDLDSNDDNVFLDNEMNMYINQSNEIIMSHA